MTRLVLLAIIFLFSSCSRENAKKFGMAKIKLQLNWYPEAEHGGYYEALHKGYYKELGLDVEIVHGAPGVRVETETALGRVDFGIANADKILAVRDKGVDVVALMSPFEKSPRCLLTHADSEVADFDSLSKAGLLILNNTKPFYSWLSEKYPAIKGVDTIPYNKATFMTNKKAVMQAYVNSEPLLMKEKNIDVRVLSVAETGFNPYTSVLICRSELIVINPELIEKMREASVKGWLSYLKNPAATNKVIKKENPANKDTLDASTELMKPLMSSQPGFGKMKPERWEELAAQLKKLGLIKAVPKEFRKVLY